MNRILIHISFLFLYTFAFSQYNLVPDSSFENNKAIPMDYSALNTNASWNSPSRATTDLFCTCGKKEKKLSRVDVPNNGMGIQNAHSGKCYAGFFACSHGYYREYLQTTLNGALNANQEYVLRMYISLSDYSPLAVNKIGVCFLKDKVRYEHSDIITNLKPIYIPLEEEVGMEIDEWHELEIRFKATGGENTLLIGSFAVNRIWKTGNYPPEQVSSPIYKKYQRDAYYYIDDVSLYEYKPEKEDTTEIIDYASNTFSETPEIVIVAPDTVEQVIADKITVFKNMLFKTGESLLNISAYKELNEIAAYLKVKPKLSIEIFGHTDNLGEEKKNLELSFNRAKAVADYMIAKGVLEKNVRFKGFGSSNPIDDNQTEEGRFNNRRVEFIIKTTGD
ncbi:MAG: OmpA family protein [Sphingobacteriaceae bacterium]|nr:OmpA family protein [Sphingobacteriaceae bacterium]